jgi:hypothetical protein
VLYAAHSAEVIQTMTMQEERQQRVSALESMVIDVQVRQPCKDCPVYAWDRNRESLRLKEMYRAQAGLPADVGVFQLEQKLELPVLLLFSASIPPGTLVQASVIGALSSFPLSSEECLYPVDHWIFVAVAVAEPSLSAYSSLEMLSPAQLEPLEFYVQAQEKQVQGTEAVQLCDAQVAARLIRETRLLLKRERRAQPKGKNWLKHEEEEQPLAWRAVEGLSESLRARLLLDKAFQADPASPHAQAEQLIRFVPQRFQEALGKLLLDDERLLAFVERPLLRHRTGLLGMQSWRSNEGLFLITDQHAIWLRDFLTPTGNFLPGGYIAHMAPLERLQNITIAPAGEAPGEYADRLESRNSPYTRLILEVASCSSSELFVVEFPQQPGTEKALAHIQTILGAFLPYSVGRADHRLRRLPAVEAWQPRGSEAERLAGLGGSVPQPVAQRLEQHLTDLLDETGEELLVSALVPALEDYKSPARLIALTRKAFIVSEDSNEKSKRSPREMMQRFDLSTITSAQLRYSLLGSSVSIFVPQSGRTEQHVFPFHSPAIARFLPLFTRLRTLLGGPYHGMQSDQAVSEMREHNYG